MPQIELGEKDLEKVDKLVKNGLFFNRQHAVKAGLESLLELSEGDLIKMKTAKREANSYCEIHLGNMLYAGMPIGAIVNDKEYFKVPVKGNYEGKTYTYGHLYVDSEMLTVDEQLSDSREKIHKTAEQLTGYDGTII